MPMQRPDLDPITGLPQRGGIDLNLPFTRTQEDRQIERLEQKRRQEEAIKERLGNIFGGGKPRMAGGGPTTKDPGDINMREYTKALGDEYNSLHEQIVDFSTPTDPAVASRYNELNQHIQNTVSRFPWNKGMPLDQQTVNRMAGQAIGVDAAAAAEGNKVGEAVGATVGGFAGGAALGVLDGPAPVLDIVGGTIGSQIGGAIGAHIPQLPAAQENQDEMLTGQHQQLISARDPRSQGRLPFGLAGTALDPENYKVY